MTAIALGQATSDVILMIDLERTTWYALDPAESAKWMTASAPTPLPSTFVLTPMTHLGFADVVAINDKPARGTFAAWGIWPYFSPTVTTSPGRPIADISRSLIWNMLFEVHDVEKGQVATLAAMGFASGPAPPGIAPGSRAGKTFTFDEGNLPVVTAPVTVTINDLPAAVSNQVGWPGTGDTYRLDVTLPSGIAAGTASVSISAAWIPGPEVKIPVR
jgi:hypothetical protein